MTPKNHGMVPHLVPFRPDIEGLRAVAGILVVLYHARLPFLQGGFIGVDIFFVVSGYLITSLLAKELNSSGGINLSRFYARRARRLLPALTLVVVIVCLIQAIIASPIVQIEVLKAALAAVLCSSNLYFAHIQLQYFVPGLETGPLLHTWSLAAAEQIYFVWPIFSSASDQDGQERQNRNTDYCGDNRSIVYRLCLAYGV